MSERDHHDILDGYFQEALMAAAAPPQVPANVLENVRQAAELIRKHRTHIACPSDELRDKIQALVDEQGVGGFYDVYTSPVPNEGQVYVFKDPTFLA